MGTEPEPAPAPETPDAAPGDSATPPVVVPTVPVEPEVEIIGAPDQPPPAAGPVDDAALSAAAGRLAAVPTVAPPPPATASSPTAASRQPRPEATPPAPPRRETAPPAPARAEAPPAPAAGAIDRLSPGLAAFEPARIAPPPFAAPSRRPAPDDGIAAPEPARGAGADSLLPPRLDSPGGPAPRGELLEVLAAYVLPGSGASTGAVLLGLFQVATVILAFTLLRPRALTMALVPLVRRRRAGYRAVVLRPG
jgi:hypothetical protein